MLIPKRCYASHPATAKIMATCMSASFGGQVSSVGSLCRQLPPYVQQPPIEAVVFGWGVNEDGQLVRLLGGFFIRVGES